MANLLTPEFEQYITKQTVNNGTVIFDEFIFANIPALNEHNLTDYLTLSAVNDHIVHRQAVSKAGVINQNSVVYSVTLGTEIGDWNYNFIGLINKSKKLLACAIQSEPIKKIKNKAGIQGNSITRSVLLEFSNAKTLTNINVNAQTWQIDFTLRLSGLDEKIRLTNRDIYGRAVFFDDGFLVTRKTGNTYNINVGTAYIEGVRANITQKAEITATNLPCSVYVDVVHHCTVTGAYETEIQFLTRSKADYRDNADHQHYVQIIADIDSRGNITDRRLLDGRYIPNSKKSNAINSASSDTVATSKAVYDLNDIKLDKVGGEAFLKTIDYTKANGYTYSGFYRPNGARLNNLPLNGLMMHITHPSYSTNAHARGICFSYGSSTGNIAWDIFTTAFDANGNHLGQKRIMTELGGTFTGNIAAPDITATGLINIANNRWGRIRATLPDGGYWQWDVNPASATDPRFNYVYRSASGEQRCLAFPQLTKNEVVAYRGWVDEKIQSIIPVGAVVAFPSAVQNPHGFLRCDGSTFGSSTYPDLYRALGNSNKLPDLRRSDVGMTAYFATDNIPAGWIAFDEIEALVSEQAYPELYRHLVAKYGSLSAVPKAKDRFIRNAGALLAVGEVQQDALQDHFHYIPTEAGGDYQAEKDITIVIRDSDTTNVVPGAFKPAQKGRVQANNTAVADGARAKTYLASTKDTTEKDTRTAEETRPKSLVLKLCIKAQNTLDGVQFWIKAFGNVSNAGELEVGRLAQDIQQVRAEKADISHTHTASEITDLKLLIKESIARSISNKSVIGGFKVMKYPDGTMIQTYCFN